MVSSNVSGIDSLIQSREKKDTVIGGEYLAFIGLWISVTYLINAFVYSHISIWLVSIALAWVAIFGFEKFQERNDGHYSTRIQKEVLSIWIIIGGFAMPTILGILPLLFDIYLGKAAVPLSYLILGIGVWLTGTVSKSTVFKYGGIAFFIGMFISLALNSNTHQLILFQIVMTLGLVVPGIVSKVNE